MSISDNELLTLRQDRNTLLQRYVDSKSIEAFNNGTELSSEWKEYRQALLDLPAQDVDSRGDIVWPTVPE